MALVITPSGSGGTAAAPSVANKTANYTLTTSDSTITATATGGAFSLTLPTAVGNSGLTFNLVRTDQTLANIITIATTSSQLIGSYGTSVTLATQDESWQLQSDGANWVVLRHYIPSNWISYPIVMGGLVPSDEGTFWRRCGDSIEIKSTFAVGSPSGTAMTFALPSGLSHDASKLSTTTNTNSTGFMFNNSGTVNYASTVLGPWPMFSDTGVSSTVFFTALNNSGSRLLANFGNQAYAAGDRGRMFLSGAPIANWKG
jgi:hypothetical protein